MSKIIYVNNIPITIEYRKVKNINLYITPPDAHVLITAPRQAAESRIREFAEGRAQWIEKSRKRMLDSREKMADELSGAITKEQMERLTEMVEAYARKWEPVMGVHATHWTFRYMKTRWGSCTVNTGRIRINTRLAYYPDECLEYIVVHELCHLIEPSHNKRFHAYMTKYLPDWKERRKKLCEKGSGQGRS
ncbi:M48 family metallopeptidase [[Clostridium] scindens]|uniref:M48 family metallopeptidase n=1 Tax=Clostridium scindens (strain JCM 10418 / VPI 12708) TaxID=29347 RepID=UPI0039964FD5